MAIGARASDWTTSNPRLHPFHWFLAIACAVAIYLLVVGAVAGSVNGGLLS